MGTDGPMGTDGDRRNVSGLPHCMTAWDMSEETFRLSPSSPVEEEVCTSTSFRAGAVEKQEGKLQCFQVV